MKSQLAAAAALGALIGACAVAPLQSIAETTGAPAASASEQRGAAAQGVTVSISPAGVRVVKQALNRLGYSAGEVTGDWNRSVADALLHFQQAHGLEPTGNLNISSIAALGLWNRLIGDPLGNGRKPLETVESLTAVPQSGGGSANALISSLPSQRITNEVPGGAQAAATTGQAAGQPATQATHKRHRK